MIEPRRGDFGPAALFERCGRSLFSLAADAKGSRRAADCSPSEPPRIWCYADCNVPIMKSDIGETGV
jgi:hypothetical protein